VNLAQALLSFQEKHSSFRTALRFENASASNRCFTCQSDVPPTPAVFYLMTMKPRNLFLAASLFALVLNGAGAAAPTTPGSKPAAASADNPEAALKQAMPADAVRKIMGQPQEIVPMKAPDGKAEIWVYKREIDQRVDRVPIGSVPITVTVIGSDGRAHEQSIGEKVQYGDLHQATEETVQLLMFNDHYLTQKTTRRDIKHYN
jgi:hypothetical protein